MVNINKAQIAFKVFLDEYEYKTDLGFELKIVHTYHVAENAKKIAEKLNLSKEDIELAELIGILHDIGRFEELKITKELNSVKFDHARHGSKMLFEKGMIRKFIEDNQYDGIIKKAIENHNKLKIEENLDERTLLHSKIIRDADKLVNMHKKGLLGGEVMPEDSNPHLSRETIENYNYYTLPMALNYQRNSYKLWESANQTWNDEETNFIFDTKQVSKSSFEQVQKALVKYKVALQQNKQTEIWIKLCNTINELFDGDIRKLFKINDYDVNKIRNYIQKENKSKFPYLSGNKICNYWLYVLYQYTDIKFKNIEELTVAPDTHVVKASYRLGIITEQELNSSNVQLIVIERWNEILKGTKYHPIDIHTPMWLWSRNGFKELE